MDLRETLFRAKLRTVRRPNGRLYRELMNNQYRPPEELERATHRKSAEIAQFAMRNTRFYRDYFTEHGVTEESLTDPGMWQRVPMIVRTMVKENRRDFRSTEASPRTTRLGLTGGSTGEPLQLYHDTRVPALALSWRMYGWWDVRPWDDLARMGRWSLSRTAALKNAVAWWPTRQIYSDAASIDDQSLRKLVADITKFHPALIEGYVGTVFELAEYLRQDHVEMPAPRAVATTSAPLTESIRTQIQNAIGAPVYDEYRGAELGWIAGECKQQHGLHIFSDMRRVEVVDDRGNPVPAGVTGDIVLTDLTNRVFPLIRYRIGDRGALMDGVCPCGVTLPLMHKPEGRLTDAIRLPSGRVINHRLDTMFSAHPDAVRLFQIHQHEDYAITVRVVTGEAPDAPRHIEHELQGFRSLLNHEVPVSVEFVDTLAYPRGKIKYVISDVEH